MTSFASKLFSWRNMLSLLWLVPAITLLILNFSGYIIGSGLACRGEACNIDAHVITSSQKAQILDEGNREVLGALQLVAKIIEIWFTLITGELVFSLAAHLSNRERVPMSLFTLYAEFLDFLYLQDLAKKLWRTIRYRGQYSDDSETETLEVPMHDMDDPAIKELQVTQMTPFIANTTTIADKPANIAEHRPFLYCFLAFVLLLSLVGGLMGVATAILTIPSLQYFDINTNNTLAFKRLLGGEKPGTINVYGCTEAALAAGEYNCTAELYPYAMDTMAESAMYGITSAIYNDATVLPPVLMEDQVSFSFNSTVYVSMAWVPLRQVLQALSTDYQDWTNATSSGYKNKAYPDSYRFNQSLDTQLQRNGPTIGVKGRCYATNATQLISIDTDKHVRCYPGITQDENVDPMPTNYTKCIPWGSGWGNSTEYSSASFTLDRPASMNVDIYATPKGRYIQSNSPCLQNTSSCDWDGLFTSPPQYNTFWNMSSYTQVSEYSMSSIPDFLVWCDTGAFLSFATYKLDPSPISNVLRLVQLDVSNTGPAQPSEENNASIPVHADWYLAAWSVTANGTVSSESVMAQSFISEFEALHTADGAKSVIIHSYTLDMLHVYISLVTMTLIPYETRDIVSSADRKEQGQREKESPVTNSILTSKATVQMWQFKLGTATGTIGVVIMVIGIVITVVRSLLYVLAPESPTDLVVTGLVHSEMEEKATGLPMRVGRNTVIFPGRHN